MENQVENEVETGIIWEMALHPLVMYLPDIDPFHKRGMSSMRGTEKMLGRRRKP